MTPRERMMTALRNKTPDRVPVAPDISTMIPCRLTGKPFWDVLLHQDPPLWKAYLNAVKRYGMDGWFTYGDLGFVFDSQVSFKTEKYFDAAADKWFLETTGTTPKGDLTEVLAYSRNDPPTKVEKLVKNFKEDFRKLLFFLPDVIGYDKTVFDQQRKELGQLGMMGVGINTPGLHVLFDYFHGNLEAATYAYYDYPDLFEELCAASERQSLKMVEMALDAGTDSILTGGSGSITMQSPDLWRKLSLPTLQKITKMCAEAGVICGIHSCGKEMYMVQVCSEETDLNYINPLEIPPMGDCTLKMCKEKYGNKLALMGNLHTTNVMLYGSPELVRLESLKAILDAGEGGGFVLSTGDQCGRDTPEENLYMMVETAKEYGIYPLDMDRISAEISRLEKLLFHCNQS